MRSPAHRPAGSWEGTYVVDVPASPMAEPERGGERAHADRDRRRPPELAELQRIALDGSGHFTSMQVRGGRIRGLDLHLARLDEGSRELFGSGLDGERVRSCIRHALAGDVRDASVRVMVHEAADHGAQSVMVTLRPPFNGPDHALALQPVGYQRTLAHVKHLGGFGQGHHARMARRAGFDDASSPRRTGRSPRRASRTSASCAATRSCGRAHRPSRDHDAADRPTPRGRGHPHPAGARRAPDLPSSGRRSSPTPAGSRRSRASTPRKSPSTRA